MQTAKTKTVKQYFYDLLVSVDQLANAFAAGNADCTISARAHVLTTLKPRNKYWQFFKWCVDYSFRPIHGHGHCERAFEIEQTEEYYAPNTLTIALFSLLIIPFCLLIIRPVTWLINILKKGN